MRKLVLLSTLFALFGAASFAQNTKNHQITPLVGPDSHSFEKPTQAQWKDMYVPGKGTFKGEGFQLKKVSTQPRTLSVRRPVTPEIAPIAPMMTPNGIYFNNYSDDRNLPLSPNGRLLSVDGFEVEFRTPNNPNDPGGVCWVQTPEIIYPSNARPPANCPFVVPCDDPVNRDANIPTGATPLKYIKLNWIVVQSTSGGAGSNIDQTRIDALMTEVNSDFLPFRIQFCSDPATFVTDDTHYSLNAGSEDGSLKTTYGTTPNNWINVYVVGNITNPSAGGYARFPYDPFGGYNIRGGVVLARGNMFVGTHTLAHELGHTFGLHHTFHGVDEVTPCTACYEDMGLAGQDTEGDWCSDTRPHPTNSNICGDNGTDACAGGIPFTASPVNNHMSYSFCTTQFTSQQAGRMHCMIDSYLSNWTAYGGSTCGNLPPVANFIGTPTMWQAPQTVTFTDLSVPQPTITNWEWNFDVTGIGGVAPTTWSGGPGVGDVPPQVVYSICDTAYTVSLRVTNANGSDTLIRTNYITPLCPAGDCDTLDNHWTTPTSTPSNYFFGPGDYLSGIPAPTLQGGPSTLPMGFYEQYFTPTPGVTTIGAIRVGLGNYVDPDSNTTMQVVAYNCDATGFPVGAPIAFDAGINPGQDLACPGPGFYFEYWFPFDCAVIDSPNFVVGVEVFPGDATDQMGVISSAAGQGQALGLNHVLCNGFGYVNYLTFVGIDFDLDIIPMLGPWQTEFYINGLGALQTCDTTLVLITDSAFYNQCMGTVSITSAYGGTIVDSSLAAVDSLFILYTAAGPDTITFTTINECGRTDTIIYTLSYPYDTTPGPIDFTMNLTNPICAGTPITFTASPTGAADYTWDFGDGTVASSGASNTTSHTYATPGLYYVSLTVTNATTCSASTTKLDFVEIIDCSVNAPIAGFDAIPDSVCLGDPILFQDTSQAVPDAATGWFWAFDDGTFSLTQSPTHTYTAAGTYTVMLVASNAGGTDTTYVTVIVKPLPCLLPLNVHLEANPVNESVVLSWEVPEDLKEERFHLERSYDGSNFSEIASMEMGNEALMSYVDVRPGTGRTIYYRLRLQSLNGEDEFSNVATATLNEGDDWVRMYPNPLDQGEGLFVDAFLANEDMLNVSLYDAQGRLVYTESREFGAGLARFLVPTQFLARGTYFLRINSSYSVDVQKLIVD